MEAAGQRDLCQRRFEYPNHHHHHHRNIRKLHRHHQGPAISLLCFVIIETNERGLVSHIVSFMAEAAAIVGVCSYREQEQRLSIPPDLIAVGRSRCPPTSSHHQATMIFLDYYCLRLYSGETQFDHLSEIKPNIQNI